MNTTEFFKHLKKENLSKLEKRAGVSRQALHQALHTQNMKLVNLNSLAKALDLRVELSPVPSEENLLASLARYGAPLAHSRGGSLSLEEALAESLNWSRRDGLYESVVPFVLIKNAKQLNVKKMVGLAYQNDQVNVLGYFAEMAQQYRSHGNLQMLLDLLVPGKESAKELLLLKTRMNFPELFERNPFAAKWNLWVRGRFADHRDRWEKWEESQKAT
jgi:hypothetical protein